MAILQQAKINRSLGETVWLLTSTKNTSDRSTPFDTVESDRPDLSADKVTAIYAVVTWDTDKVAYDEVGHLHNVGANVSSTVGSMKAMQNCYAVRFSDGSVLKKTSEKLSDERTSYIIHVSGQANVVNP
jgi:hypothetical protein